MKRINFLISLLFVVMTVAMASFASSLSPPEQGVEITIVDQFNTDIDFIAGAVAITLHAQPDAVLTYTSHEMAVGELVTETQTKILTNNERGAIGLITTNDYTTTTTNCRISFIYPT